jgi:hypothetical protein
MQQTPDIASVYGTIAIARANHGYNIEIQGTRFGEAEVLSRPRLSAPNNIAHKTQPPPAKTSFFFLCNLPHGILLAVQHYVTQHL